jgi:hypothetical protein
MTTLVRRYLDPGERLGEIVFGLIMVLTFTLTAGLTIGESPNAHTELLIAVIGCNVAWGIIDGGMYIMGAMLDRARAAQPGTRIGLIRGDVMGAIACFLLVVISLIPAAVPFLFIDNARRALRTSNGLLVGMLFLTGYMWGRHAKTNSWWAGGVFLVVGLALVVIAIALGG